MRMLGNATIISLTLFAISAQPSFAQVNMQYDGQYSGQYRGQFNGRYSGQYYGAGSAGQLTPLRDDLGYPVNTGSCGQLYYPEPGTDYVLHDRQGRRCF